MDNKLLLQSKHRKHRRRTFYGKEKAEIASLVEKYGRVQSLMKYVNKDTLKESYSKQPKGKAVGVDEVTKEEYGERLEENIENLLVRMKKFSYRPYPVRRAYIPKGDGKMRGLGIPSFEDKVVQGVFKEILESIYEPKFKEFSFGFRSNKSCHDAIQRVNKHIMADKCILGEWLIEEPYALIGHVRFCEGLLRLEPLIAKEFR